MIKNDVSSEKKRLNVDLLVIVIVSLAALSLAIIFQSQFYAIVRDDQYNILLRVLIAAAFQFGLAGLGITIVSIVRKESFLSHGLRIKGSFLSVVLCALCFVPHLIFLLATSQITGYLPFQSVWTTKDVLASGFPINAMGFLITSIVWGFFEGFNYVVISDKINKRFPSKNKWLNWGAIICAILCILVHGAIGVTVEGIFEMLTIMVVIYGMLMVKEHTGNAWGCVFIFVLLWNAF